MATLLDVEDDAKRQEDHPEDHRPLETTVISVLSDLLLTKEENIF